MKASPLTFAQKMGKERCWLVRKFGSKPAVVSEFWIKMSAGGKALGRIKSSGRTHPQKCERVVSESRLYATRREADLVRDEITKSTPLLDYTNSKVIFGQFH